MGMGIQLEEMLELSATTQSIISQEFMLFGLGRRVQLRNQPANFAQSMENCKIGKVEQFIINYFSSDIILNK